MANTSQYDSQTNIELEDYEREIFVQPEAAVIYGGSVVNSVNGQTGDVVLTTSDLENTSDYQTGAQVQSAIAGKQDKLTAGTGIDITSDVVSVDTTTIATHQDITNEATARENADTNLQGQIDALTVSSGVIDVLGTYQDLQNYDTTHVKENDIIKVLQDSTHSNAMSYYKWVITGNVGAWVYVGSEGPFYTKSEADILLNSKQNTEDNSLETSSKTIVGAINEVDSIAKGANQALSFASYAAMVTEFNSLDDDVYNVGQNIYIRTLEVPDLWISSVESTSATYTYVDDATFISALDTDGYVQVGYYKLSALETQKVDLTNYATKTDYATSDVGGVIKVTTSNGFSMTNGNLRASTITYENYINAPNNTNIGKATLENVIAGKGLVSNTDYATAEKGGTIRTSNASGLGISNGNLYAVTKAYNTYSSASNNMFIGKGTLENVITGKGLVDQTALAGKQDTLTAGNGISINNNVISATGGGGPTVVQTTGTSTTDVMSQNATTSLVYADPATRTKIKIGDGAYANEGQDGVEIGHNAKAGSMYAIGIGSSAEAKGTYSVALGYGAESVANGVSLGRGARAQATNAVAFQRSYTTTQGQVQFELVNAASTEGYNNSKYRLLSGLYDGQSAHDAATVAQGNTLATSAPTTSTVGALGQLYTDTTNMHTYQCTAISGDTYTWTQRW